MPGRKAFSKDSDDDRVTIVLRRGFCPTSLLQPPTSTPSTSKVASTSKGAVTVAKEDPKSKNENKEGSFKFKRQFKEEKDDQSQSNKNTKKQKTDYKSKKAGVTSSSQRDDNDDDDDDDEDMKNKKSDDTTWFQVCYAKASARKHKKFDCDGFLGISKQNTFGVLKSEDGKVLGRSGLKFTDDRRGGEIFSFCGQDLQVSSQMIGAPEFNEEKEEDQNKSNENDNTPKQKIDGKGNKAGAAGVPSSYLRGDDDGGDTKNKKSDDDDTTWFQVCYAKASARKHKQFDCDGFLGISKQNTFGVLKSEDGKVLGRSGLKFTDDRRDGEIFSFCGQDLQVSSEMSSPPEFKEEASQCVSTSVNGMKLENKADDISKEEQEEEEEEMDLSPSSIVQDDPTEQNATAKVIKKPKIDLSIYQRYQPSSFAANINPPPQDPASNADTVQHYYCSYSRKSKRKIMKWEKDGYLTISNNMSYGVFRDEKFNIIFKGRYNFDRDMIEKHEHITFAGKDFRIDEPMKESDIQDMLSHDKY